MSRMQAYWRVCFLIKWQRKCFFSWVETVFDITKKMFPKINSNSKLCVCVFNLENKDKKSSRNHFSRITKLIIITNQTMIGCMSVDWRRLNWGLTWVNLTDGQCDCDCLSRLTGLLIETIPSLPHGKYLHSCTRYSEIFNKYCLNMSMSKVKLA